MSRPLRALSSLRHHLAIRALAICALALPFLLATASAQPLRLLAPNGGERFKVGSSTTIRWTGSSADTVTLEYSTDNGANWSTIATGATGGQYIWTKVPNTPSETCLMRVSRAASVGDSVLHLQSKRDGNFIPDPIHFAEFSPDGLRVAGGSATGYLFIWDSFTGDTIRTVLVDTTDVPSNPGITLISCVRYSPDGKLIATISPLATRTGSTIRLFDAATSAKVREWVHDEGADYPSSAVCAFSPDGGRLLVTGLGAGTIFNVADGSIAATLKGYTATVGTTTEIGSMVDGDWRRDGAEILGASLAGLLIPKFIVSDPITGDTIRTFDFPSFGNTQSVRYNRDGTRFLSTSYDGTAHIHDAATGAVLVTIKDYGQYPNYGIYSNGGGFFVLGGQDTTNPNWKLRLYDSSGAFVRTVAAIISGIRNIEFSPDDSRIMIAGIDGVRIFQAPQVTPGQSDISDSLWAIYLSAGEIVTVAAPMVTARQGELVDVPITISDPGAALGAGATRIDLTLRYNVTLLDPIGATPRGVAGADERVIGLSFPIGSATDTVLGVLRFRAALGNDSTTTLDLENVVADVSSVTVVERDGLFRLSDLCREGGPRLLNPNGAVALKLRSRGSISSQVEAELETIEGGRTTLTLVDMMGRRVKSLFDGEAPPGSWRMALPLDDVPQGRYFVVLATRTVTKSQAMEVVR